MPHPRGLMVLSVLLLALVACGRTPVPLTHDAYVWQRQWSPSLTFALNQSADLIRDWRVLAAQTDAKGQLRNVAIDRAALAATGRPVILVVRIDGQLVQWDEDALIAQIVALRNDGAGVAGIEIDHDCGTARLPAYAHFLGRLKLSLGTLPLSITALPAWLSSRDLDTVLGAVDEAVLQVHAVQSPRAGLFDVALAQQWVGTFAKRSKKPFRVALPNYGSKVSWDGDGRMIAIESEAPALSAGAESRELAAAPRDVARLLKMLHDDPPAHFAGVVWFRLPTADDVRSWSLPTWRAVIQGRPLTAQVAAIAQPGAVAGALDILLRNDGDVDASLPIALSLPHDCAIADGINGYQLDRRSDGLYLKRSQDGWLRSHRQRQVGWMRCTSSKVDIHVAN
ncbi:DUF3142 domain-containing protein [Dyella tabacisoli]|uniref:DUF3142 domain-containing protein n=1 Tax=Dyella tabacisoli TaxID=2282381 RepID=A0A369UR75_9GAMM|nr:DUF3142 domain-containing protein [Dyella tabacisoli]RDD82555.1 DUF3142 domain-containing protein [Dyella tabacisoli]